MFKTTYFDELSVGQTMNRLDVVITDQMLDDYCRVTGAAVPQKTNGQGKRQIPPIILSLFCFGVYKNTMENPPNTLHARQEFNFLAPLFVDDPLTFQATIAEKYVKNNRNYIVFSYDTKRGNEVVSTALMTILWAK